MTRLPLMIIVAALDFVGALVMLVMLVTDIRTYLPSIVIA